MRSHGAQEFMAAKTPLLTLLGAKLLANHTNRVRYAVPEKRVDKRQVDRDLPRPLTVREPAKRGIREFRRTAYRSAVKVGLRSQEPSFPACSSRPIDRRRDQQG